MKISRFTESQIVSILKEAGAGLKVSKICRKPGISNTTYYNWKSNYGHREASDLRCLNELVAELSQYNRTYADLAGENNAYKEVIAKKL